MVILVILLLLLGGYSFYLIKKLDKKTNIHLNDIKIKLHEKDLYLLSELDNKIKINEESLLKKLKEINNQNQKDNNIKHEQLISNEFTNLRDNISKDMEDLVGRIMNSRIL